MKEDSCSSEIAFSKHLGVPTFRKAAAIVV